MPKAKSVSFRDKADDGIGQSVDNSKQVRIPAAKRHAGSIKGKIEVIINERTRIYVKPGTDIDFIRHKYA